MEKATSMKDLLNEAEEPVGTSSRNSFNISNNDDNVHK